MRHAARLALACLALLAQLPGAARGHAEYRPFSANRSAVISFEAPGVHLRYDVTIGDVPARRLRERLDADRDGILSAAEGQALASELRARIAGGLSLRLDGQEVRPEVAAADLELVSAQTEMLAPLRLRLHLVIACGPGRHALVYEDGATLEDLAQTELLVEPGPGTALARFARTEDAAGVEPRLVWEGGEAPATAWLEFEGRGVGRAPAATAPLLDGSDPLKRALADRALGPLGLLAALGLAFALGALHALSPGHGKTLVAAYLVGARGTLGHALLLGLLVTATHVAAVFALGVVALAASEHALPERLLPWLEVAAALLVTGLGAFMLLRRLRVALLHRLAHAQGAAHEHAHEHGQAQGVRLGELVGLGVSGGMVPCPSATVVLLMAIYVGRVGLGLALLAAFSLGLAATLVALGVLVVKVGALSARLGGERFQAWARWLPAVSAGLILCIGAAMTVAALVGMTR